MTNAHLRILPKRFQIREFSSGDIGSFGNGRCAPAKANQVIEVLQIVEVFAMADGQADTIRNHDTPAAYNARWQDLRSPRPGVLTCLGGSLGPAMGFNTAKPIDDGARPLRNANNPITDNY